ncbi:triacylglycerol lipase OBL1 [Lotus japonicus]|uniref:triacylglycerol lipase OBL1 n=1 Tax=Lotus japonicus TaxID=34305 RepID=UPI002588B4D6|nr:triacylglycerol lipase OBL1 [Lotus japonicus]
MASEEEPSGGKYLLLKPEEASLVDLVRLLFSSNLNNRKFIECPIELKAENFRQRWLLFISVVVQKILVSSGSTLKKIGDMFELWLNRVSSNGGLVRLLLNIIRGKMITPEPSSATFLSVVGNLDSRVELDKSIKQVDLKYKGMLSMMASKLSYENEQFIKSAVTNHWEMDFLGLYSFWNDYQELWSTRAMIVQDTKSEPNLIVVGFRGTEPFDADQWRTDLDISWYELPDVGKVHGGFMRALGVQNNNGWPKEIVQTEHRYAYYTIREKLRALLEANEDAKFILTGHSLGGALAILFAAVLTFHDEAWLLDRLEGVYTFGQPRVGDHKFGEYMKDKLRKYDVRYLRYVYCNDMVPRVPYDDKTLFFKHFGPCLYFNSLYLGQVREEEPNKNYFSLFWVIPKILNAVWELVRGFLIPLFRGMDYRQNWFMAMFRLLGLIIPGLPAHSPSDYVNVTRLGSLPAHLGLQSPLLDSKAD